MGALLRRKVLRISARNGTKGFSTAQSYIDLEDKYGAHNYAPIPVVLSKGQGM